MNVYIFSHTGNWKCVKGERKSASGYAWRKAKDGDTVKPNENDNAAASNAAIMPLPIIVVASSATHAMKHSHALGVSY